MKVVSATTLEILSSYYFAGYNFFSFSYAEVEKDLTVQANCVDVFSSPTQSRPSIEDFSVCV